MIVIVIGPSVGNKPEYWKGYPRLVKIDEQFNRILTVSRGSWRPGRGEEWLESNCRSDLWNIDRDYNQPDLCLYNQKKYN